MNADSKKVGGDDCYLCGGSGEVVFTPAGDPESQQDCFGCPGCMQADRDEAIGQRNHLLAELEKALDSLEYVEQHLPGLAGCGVRQERIASGRAAIAAVKGEYMQLSGRFSRPVDVSTDWPLRGTGEKGGAA